MDKDRRQGQVRPKVTELLYVDDTDWFLLRYVSVNKVNMRLLQACSVRCHSLHQKTQLCHGWGGRLGGEYGGGGGGSHSLECGPKTGCCQVWFRSVHPFSGSVGWGLGGGRMERGGGGDLKARGWRRQTWGEDKEGGS